MSNVYEKLRNHVGLIDLANWTRMSVTGADATDALDSVMGGNMLDLFEGKAMNTLIPTVEGGVEAIVWVIATANGFEVVAEPEDKSAVSNVLNALSADYAVEISDLSDTQFHLVLTGPEAEALAETALGDEILSIAFLNAFELPSEVLAARIGYFGEYELHLFGTMDNKSQVMSAINGVAGEDITTDQSAFPAMMAEMRVLNRARDIAPEASVFDAGLQWMVDFQKDNLRGADALATRRDAQSRACVLMVMDDADVSQGALAVEGEEIGHVQSAYPSATLGKTVALAYLDTDIAAPGLVLDTSSGKAMTVSAPAFLSKSVTNAMGQAA